MVSNHWNQASTPEHTLNILRDLGLRHARLAGSYGTHLCSLLESRDWASICSYEVNYNEGIPVHAMIHIRQALGFFSKLEDLDIGIDKEAAALATFIESESLCSHTNDVFGSYLAGGFNFLPQHVCKLFAARDKISKILGAVPTLGELKLQFGPGSTTNVQKRNACPQRKFAGGIVCSEELYRSGYLEMCLDQVPHWTTGLGSTFVIDPEGWLCERLDVTIDVGKLSFTAKNAKTYRGIVTHPTLNTMFQKGVGSYIASRLRKHGIDITDQSRNQRLARLGSLTGELATLDLSSASDTIARQLVRFLLPPEWFAFLQSFRTGQCSYKGQLFNLEKFSSMGNGFTFPLETLIFWALTWSVCRTDNISVYGDDIICPSENFEEVVDILALCGFSVNSKKSFSQGPFRESCGHDYYFGINIRPYYQKNLISGQTLFTLHNHYYRDYDFDSCDHVLGLIPESLRIFGPDGYGDGHLISDSWNRGLPAKLLKKGYRGSRFETFLAAPKRQAPRFPGDYVSPLYSTYVSGGDYHSGLRFRFAADKTRCDPNGFPLWSLPCSEIYNRVKIYTLSA